MTSLQSSASHVVGTRSGVAVRLAESQRDQRQIWQQRCAEYERSFPHLLVPGSGIARARDEADHRSHLFLVEASGRLTASVRYTWDRARFCPQLVEESRARVRERVGDSVLEVARLIVAPEFRGRRHLDLLLQRSIEWIQDHCAERRWFAICGDDLIPLYRLYGGVNDGVVDLERRDGTRRTYALMSGGFDAAHAIASRRATRASFQPVSPRTSNSGVEHG